MCRDITEHHRVSPYPSMRANHNGAQNLCARSDVYMTRDLWHSSIHHTKGNLLKDQAVRPDDHIAMNDHSIGVREQQATADLAANRDVSPGHCAPEAVAKYGQLAPKHTPRVA